jgi:hypothetical protein
MFLHCLRKRFHNHDLTFLKLPEIVEDMLFASSIYANYLGRTVTNFYPFEDGNSGYMTSI